MKYTIGEIDVLVRNMTIDEKVAQLYAAWLVIEENGDFSVKSIAGNASEIKATKEEVLKFGIGQITRPFGTRPIDPISGRKGINVLQKYLVEKTRLGIPAILHEECLAGLMVQNATQFPTGINYGSTWDENIVKSAADVIRCEMKSIGVHQGLAPVLDVARDARWGRSEESMGEDPYLVGQLACAYVRGLQGEQRDILATLKHFVGHSFSEGGRNHAPVRIGKRELSDIFCLPFEMAVKQARAGSVMPAYHDLDGEPCSSSYELLTDLLRNKWGFDGLIVSDYEAISQLHSDHKTARDMAEAAAKSLKAGMDMELPGSTGYAVGLKEALSRKLLDIADIDAAVKRVLREKFRLGFFDHPFLSEDPLELSTPEHRQVARVVAQKSFVLIKNDDVLPLKTPKKIALIGPLAHDPFAMFCGYSFPTHLLGSFDAKDTIPKNAKTLYQALQEYDHKIEILYSKGCDIITNHPNKAVFFPGDIEQQEEVENVTISTDMKGFDDALAVAQEADTIVLALGDIAGLFKNGTVGEGSDTTSLRLPGVQQQLLTSILAVGKPTTVVLINGRPYNLELTKTTPVAILETWMSGETGSEAIVATLFGEVNPGGKIPVSFPKTVGALPYAYNHKAKSAGVPAQREFGYQYPFGFGLSYTTFSIEQCTVHNPMAFVEGEFFISCKVINTGVVTGDEVVQLYVRDLYASLVRPIKELKGFKRITINPGQSADILFKLPVDMLSYTTEEFDRVVEPGEFELMIGNSSEHIVFRQKVLVEGSEIRVLPKIWRMTTKVQVTYS